jgi:hypothetical protein
MLFSHGASNTICEAGTAYHSPRAQAYRRRALELLAGCGPEGCTEAIMKAHGFAVEQMIELVRVGLAAAVPGKVKTGGQTPEVARLRIIVAGRKALEEAKA